MRFFSQSGIWHLASGIRLWPKATPSVRQSGSVWLSLAQSAQSSGHTWGRLRLGARRPGGHQFRLRLLAHDGSGGGGDPSATNPWRRGTRRHVIVEKGSEKGRRSPAHPPYGGRTSDGAAHFGADPGAIMDSATALSSMYHHNHMSISRNWPKSRSFFHRSRGFSVSIGVNRGYD